MDPVILADVLGFWHTEPFSRRISMKVPTDVDEFKSHRPFS